jgi:hypothetical protein
MMNLMMKLRFLSIQSKRLKIGVGRVFHKIQSYQNLKMELSKKDF